MENDFGPKFRKENRVPRKAILFAPIVALSTLVALLLQLNDILLIWKREQGKMISCIRPVAKAKLLFSF